MSAPPPPPPPSLAKKKGVVSFTLPRAATGLQPGDRDRLLQEIQSGKRLRHVQTVDKSKPIVQAEVEETGEPVYSHHYAHSYTAPSSDAVDHGEDLYRPEEFAPIGETGFVPSYGRVQAAANGSTAAPVQAEKPKPHAGFYMEAEPPPPSSNPLVDETPMSVDGMIGVFDNILQNAEEEARLERLRAPRRRVDTSQFEAPRSKSCSALQPQAATLPPRPANGHFYYRPPSPSQGQGRQERQEAPPLNGHSARDDSPPRFSEAAFAVPEAFQPAELLANRYVSPVVAPSIRARDEIASIEARARQAATLPRRQAPSARRAPAFPYERPPQDVYAEMASQSDHRNGDDYFRFRSANTGSPFVPEELIANRYIPSDYPLPELTPMSAQAIHETQSGLHPVSPPRRGSFGASRDRTFVSALLHRNEAEAELEMARTDHRHPDQERRLDSLIKPGTSRQLASQFEERSRSNSPAPFQPPPRRSASTHAFLAFQAPYAPHGYGGSEEEASSEASSSQQCSPVYGRERGSRAVLPSVAGVRAAFERPPPPPAGLARTHSEGPAWAPPPDRMTDRIGVPWQRIFQDRTSRFLPDVGRLADAFEERAQPLPYSNPPTPSPARP